MNGHSRRTLRFALSMRGGVSLSVWIGGAVQEIDRLRRDLDTLYLTTPEGTTGEAADDATTTTRAAAVAAETSSTLALVARALGHEQVEIDVLSGASAGGLNAVVLGAAMVSGREVDGLRLVWLRQAELQDLIRPCSPSTKLSILDGDYFLKKIGEALEKFAVAPPASGPRTEVSRVDVFLSVTSVVPLEVRAVNDPTAPVVEQRVDGLIRLRHRAPDTNAADGFEGYSDFSATAADDQAERTRDLALAARSTASFPVAFQPVPIHEDELEGKLQMRPERPERLQLYDGGVVDNMPVGKSVRAIDAAPADGPTERVLIYLHPSPTVTDPEHVAKAEKAADDLAEHGARPLDVVGSALKAFRGKSLVEDLHELDEHNARVSRYLVDREGLLQRMPAPSTDVPVAPPGVGATASMDAERLVDLLYAPWDHLEDLYPPVEVVPLLGPESGMDRRALVEALESQLTARTTDSSEGRAALPSLSIGSLRPWGALLRSASILIEWCRAIEKDGGISVEDLVEVGALKAACYRARGSAYRSACKLNRATLGELAPDVDALPEPYTIDATNVEVEPGTGLEANDDTVPAAPSKELLLAVRLCAARGALVDTETQSLENSWDRICQAAVRLRSLAPPPPAGYPVDVPWRWMGGVVTRQDAAARLDAVDVQLLPLHRTAPTGSLDRVRYHTLTGTAATPLAFELPVPDLLVANPHVVSIRKLVTFRELRPADGRSIDPGSKLAGNQFHNFAAFLEKSWRASDWMWGQLDAAASLVDLLFDPASPTVKKAITDDALPGCLLRIVSAPIVVTGTAGAAESAPASEFVAAVNDLLVELGKDGALLEVIRSDLRAMATGAIPEATKWLLLLRRHLEIIALELARPMDENPTGAEPAATLSQAVTAWDAAPRKVDAEWGAPKLAALGMRAVFVGWRTLFARAGWALSTVRILLAPVLAPIVGFVLARRRSIAAVELFLLGAVLPRTADHSVGRWVVALAGVAVLGGGLWATRSWEWTAAGRRAKRWKLEQPWSILSIVLTLALLGAAAFIDRQPLVWLTPDFDRPDPGLWPYVAPVVATLLSTWIMWFWAQWIFRLLVSVLAAGIVAFWVAYGGDQIVAGSNGTLHVSASFWWAVIALALLTTLIGYNADIGRYRARRPDD